MELTFGVGEAIAGIALLLSVYATVTTAKFNRRQRSLIESQERLNALLVSKESAASASERQADLGASFVKLGNTHYRLKIWNQGKAPARNVSVRVHEGSDVVSQSDIDRKLPLEVLERHQSVELRAFVHMGSKAKHPITLVWSDDSNDHNEKVVYPTL